MIKPLFAGIRLLLITIIFICYLVILLLAFILGINLKVRYKLVKQWAKITNLVLGIQVDVNQKEIPEGVLVLPNHRSYLDIPLIFSIIPATIISKKEISYWPIIGWGFLALDAILVDRSKIGSLVTTFKKIEKKILENKTVILFPEGTIYKGPETGKFKNGAFRVAAEHHINIVPIAFEYKNRRNVWVSDESLFSHYFKTMGITRTYIKVKIGDTISSNDEKWLNESTKKWMDDEIIKMRADWDNK